MKNKINVEYDIDNLKIILKTTKYIREITCKSLESYIEEIRRIAVDIKDFSNNFKEDEEDVI